MRLGTLTLGNIIITTNFYTYNIFLIQSYIQNIDNHHCLFFFCNSHQIPINSSLLKQANNLAINGGAEVRRAAARGLMHLCGDARLRQAARQSGKLKKHIFKQTLLSNLKVKSKV